MRAEKQKEQVLSAIHKSKKPRSSSELIRRPDVSSPLIQIIGPSRAEVNWKSELHTQLDRNRGRSFARRSIDLTSPGRCILELRRLHGLMDAAVLRAYGWDDLAESARCEFLLDDEEEEEVDSGQLSVRRVRKNLGGSADPTNSATKSSPTSSNSTNNATKKNSWQAARERRLNRERQRKREPRKKRPGRNPILANKKCSEKDHAKPQRRRDDDTKPTPSSASLRLCVIPKPNRTGRKFGARADVLADRPTDSPSCFRMRK